MLEKFNYKSRLLTMILMAKSLSEKGVLEARLSPEEKALIISDLHLGQHSKRAYSEVSEMLRLLNYAENSSEEDFRNIKHIVLNGDIIDFWRANLRNLIVDGYKFLERILKMEAEKLYVSGNHDYFTLNMKIKGENPLFLVPYFVVLKIKENNCEKKVIVIHGHQFDPTFSWSKGLWKIFTYTYSLTESLFSLPSSVEWWLSFLSAVTGVVLLYSIAEGIIFGSINRLFAFYGSLILLMPLILLTLRKIQEMIWYVAVPSISIITSKLRRKRGLVNNKYFAKWLREVESKLGKVDCIVFGHTHEPFMTKLDETLVVNCGSWLTEEKRPASKTFVLISGNGKVKLFKWQDAPILIREESI